MTTQHKPRYVRVDKLGEHCPKSGVPTHYWVEGEMIGEMVNDQPLCVLRYKNPRGYVPGIFKTSPIRAIDIINPGEDSVVFRTEHSTYKLTYLNNYVVPDAVRIAFGES